MLAGSLLVFSASGTYSAFKFANVYALFKSHIGKVIIAFGALAIVAAIPYEQYRLYSKYAMLAILGILILTLIMGIEKKGAARWIDLGVFRFQPAELAKLVLLIHLANIVERKDEYLQDFKKGLILSIIWIGVFAFLIILQPNVSTAALIVLTGFTILYVGGAKFKHIAATLGGTGLAGLGGALIFPHSRERIFSFVGSLLNGGDINMQVKQAKIALGSGGFWGVGIGHSRQSDLFLPEPYGDFIFSILGEELGLLGTLVVMAVFTLVFITGLMIAKNADTKFGQVLAFGLSFNIILTAYINAMVVMGMLPTTGITLPFISFGGTSVIVFCMSIGILVNIALQTERRREPRILEI